VKVKDELAGRKGICPQCQARFRIPVAGTELPVARVVSLDHAFAARLPRAAVIGGGDLLGFSGASPTDPPVAGQGRRDPQTTMEARSGDVPAEAFEPLDGDSDAQDSEEASASLPADVAPPRLHPVLEERPDLVWCVAIPGGEPSPPFTPEALQRWLEAGLATGEELVWRADWTEWVPMRTVFPGFSPGE
jgi:hypothetical protein